MKYPDRRAAGRRLARKLAYLKDLRPVVLALPRGGVAIGFEIAQALDAPVGIVLVRKIGVPPELALGAVTDGAAPDIFIDWDLATCLDIPESYIRTDTGRRRMRSIRSARKPMTSSAWRCRRDSARLAPTIATFIS